MTINSLSQEVSKRAAWSIFMGVLTAAVGVVMIVYPAATAAVSTIFLGVALIIAGVAQLIFAFSSDTAGNYFLKLLLALAYGIAGIALTAFPIAGVLTLTGVLGTMLIVQAVLEGATAFTVLPGSSRAWFVVSSIASLVLGVMILSQWPNSAAWAVGTLVGAGVLMNGVTRIVVSTMVRSGARETQRLVSNAA